MALTGKDREMVDKSYHADIELRPTGFESIAAWVDGKYLGVVHTDGDGVYVRLNSRSLREAGRRAKSASNTAFHDAVEHGEGGA